MHARTVITEDKTKKLVNKELGWASLQLFDFEQFLAQGTFFLNIWPPESEKQIGPAPDSGSHPYADTCALLSIELPELTTNVIYPVNVPVQDQGLRMDYNFNDLDYYTQQMLLDICDQDIFTFTEMPINEREVLWEKRYYLTNLSGKILFDAQCKTLNLLLSIGCH